MIKLKSKKLEKKVDDRGYLAELLDGNDVDNGKFGQLIITTANPGFTKGKHYHLRKREWYMVIGGRGTLLVRDRDSGQTEEKVLSSNSLELVEIPVGYYHEITNDSDEQMLLLTYTNEIYNPEDPDTFYE